MKKPIKRSVIRSKLGLEYYKYLRYLLWFKQRRSFASNFNHCPLPYTYFTHKSLLLRPFKDVEMWMQHNKVVNLKIAISKLNGLIIEPNQVLSYWKCIGKPTKSKGYLPGMVLRNGKVEAGIGGGLCQLSNLIFWMTIHTPLTILERHRHDYDVFPDVNRSQPFGSGATCFWPHGDLMIKNNTNDTFQLHLELSDTHLIGSIKVNNKPYYKYEIEERNHEIKPTYWGGYLRYNELYQKCYNDDKTLVYSNQIVKNEALLMYEPLIEAK